MSNDDFDLFGFESEQPATLEEEKPRPPRHERRPPQPGRFANLVSFFFLILTGLSLIGTVLLILNPFIPLNPFPPAPPEPTMTLFPLGVATGTEEGALPATWTPSPEPTDLPTPTPSVTPTSSATPLATATGVTAQPISAPTTSVFPFTLQNEAVTYTENANEEGCAWLSIAGQVFGLDGEPLVGLPVQVIGESFEQIEFTGTALDFGPSGYEVFLNTTPIEAEFQVRLLNTTGAPLSETIIVRTLSSCERNVAIVNFVQNHEY